jgi:hypothetical protein
MTDLTEKNLENVLLNLTKTDKPIAVKPTTWFGNPAKTAQWYTCPNCSKQSPLTLEWVGLTDREMMDAISLDDTPMEMGRKIEQALKERNT